MMTLGDEKKKKNWLEVLGIVGGTAGLAFIVFLTISNITKDKQLNNMHNELAKVAELQRYEGDRLASDIAYLQNNITAQNHTIKQLRRDVRYFSNIALEADSIRVVTITPRPVETDGVQAYPISWYDQGVRLNGSFTLPARQFDALLLFDPIDMSVYLTQSKDGIWETWVETNNPNWRVGAIHSEVTPYQKAKNFQFMLGTYGGSVADGYRFGGRIGVGYKGYIMSVFGDRFGVGLGLQKVWWF